MKVIIQNTYFTICFYAHKVHLCAHCFFFNVFRSGVYAASELSYLCTEDQICFSNWSTSFFSCWNTISLFHCLYDLSPLHLWWWEQPNGEWERRGKSLYWRKIYRISWYVIFSCISQDNTLAPPPEEKAHGTVSTRTYIQYLRAGGSYLLLLLVILALVLGQVRFSIALFI